MQSATARVFKGTDETSRLIKGGEWDDSILGKPTTWPPRLRSAMDIMLPAMAQIVVVWGPELIALYNEPYAPTIGLRHPKAFGRPARENWAELWDDLGPLLRRVMDDDETVTAKDRPFYIKRHGYPETVYFDISYSAVHDEDGLVRGIFCIINETTDRVRADLALQESEERLRAVVLQSAAGIGRGSPEGCTSTAGFVAVAAFEARLSALARAHDLLADGDWQVANLAAVVEQAVAPFPPERFDLSGPSVLLPQKAVATLFVALHELGTNAAKYGALSTPSGQVTIIWKHDPKSGGFGLRWKEPGGPSVTPPARKGFGSRLIERLRAAELNGSSTIGNDPSGVRCEIEAVLPPHTKA